MQVSGSIRCCRNGVGCAVSICVIDSEAESEAPSDPRPSVRAVTVSFDVPQTDRTAEPFAAWQASAQALAIGMDADIVDDNGRPLDADGFAAIGGQLGQLYDALAARDLAAGSAAARRLFS